MSYYLGLDLSTQQLKCTIIDESHTIVLEEAVNFDRDLPEFGTKHGAIQCGDVVTSPTLMWVKAMDMLFERLHKHSADVVGKIRGISGAGQQHGSVYWSDHGVQTLSQLNPQQALADQLQDAFSIDQSPIWQDASTTQECRSLESLVGGAQALADLTGSKGYERFTGNQIAKIYHTRRAEYDRTAHISLVSSFIATLLLGRLAPVDASEGSGTNLMNIKTHTWEKMLLEHCGGHALQAKLGLEPVEGGIELGKINPYYVERFGLPESCTIMPFTGDNSATLASMNLHEGDCVVSLGTSDTVLVYLKQGAAKATTEAHLMAHPTDPNGFMGMLCYKNGSLTRQHVRDQYASADWDTFNALLQKDTHNAVGFYYSMQEIIPFAKGFYRFVDGKPVQEFADPAINVRAIVESQFMSMRIRLARMTSIQSKRILATGGAAANPELLKILSNILGLPVYKQKGQNSASLGGALLAKFGTRKDNISFEDMMKQQEHRLDGAELVCKPDLEATKTYAARVDEYIRLENEVVGTA
ncbi:hypothetical protein BX666DRAFT_1965620 [Dichotomocladium elegans]|nr:hypothetical protein BX666DRAFT_1965620 [Dichotomocladium elegans]